MHIRADVRIRHNRSAFVRMQRHDRQTRKDDADVFKLRIRIRQQLVAVAFRDRLVAKVIGIIVDPRDLKALRAHGAQRRFGPVRQPRADRAVKRPALAVISEDRFAAEHPVNQRLRRFFAGILNRPGILDVHETADGLSARFLARRPEHKLRADGVLLGRPRRKKEGDRRQHAK